MDAFKNTVIICDRAYHCYRFFDFLINNDIKFIIRVKTKEGKTNLDLDKSLKKGTNNYKIIKKLRNDIRVIKSKKILKHTVNGGSGKKKVRKYNLVVRDNCVLVTNLKDSDKYSDEYILNQYQSRWDIETFFKYLKNNYKFQQLKEEDQKSIKKMYICELIVTYITKLIENYAINIINKKKSNNKVNKTHLTTNTFKFLLYRIINGNLDRNYLDNFCKTCITYCHNKPNRHFPRFAKRPFCKWYVKAYSNQSSYNKIITAVINGTIDTLNKNQKLIANNIISINGKKYG